MLDKIFSENAEILQKTRIILKKHMITNTFLAIALRRGYDCLIQVLLGWLSHNGKRA